MIRAVARAKVNLRLAVLGKRPDGYHDLETVMQSISLADELIFERADHSDVVITWAEGLEGPMPQHPDIVQRTMAAVRLPEHERVRIHVVKRIPIGAGLGGASADAAAALLGLEKLQGDPLARLLTDQIAVELGADVPFCLKGGIARATGIGEKLEPLDCAIPLWWVIGISEAALPTVGVYRRFDELARSPSPCDERGSTAAMAEALAHGDVEAVASNLANDLEPAAFDLMPVLERLKGEMTRAGALGSVMTGSGSAIIGLCRSEDHAAEVAGRAEASFPRVEVASGTPAGAEIVAG